VVAVMMMVAAAAIIIIIIIIITIITIIISSSSISSLTAAVVVAMFITVPVVISCQLTNNGEHTSSILGIIECVAKTCPGKTITIPPYTIKEGHLTHLLYYWSGRRFGWYSGGCLHACSHYASTTSMADQSHIKTVIMMCFDCSDRDIWKGPKWETRLHWKLTCSF